MFAVKEIKSQPSSTAVNVCTFEGIEESICSFLLPKETFKTSVACGGLYSIQQNELFWRARYQQEYGFFIFDVNYREQYTAMHLYQLAQSPRVDKSQFYYRKLFAYIEGHKDKNWAWFFLAVMHFHGNGVAADLKQGAEYLNKSIRAGDYRAAQLLVNVLVAKNPTELEVVNTLEIATLKSLCLDCLTKAYAKGVTTVAREIGYFHALHNEAKMDAKSCEEAKVHFTAHLIRHPTLEVAEAFSKLFLIPAEENANPIAWIAENHAAIQQLTHICKQSPSGAVACQIGILYDQIHDLEGEIDDNGIDNLAEAQCWFERAIMLGNGHAGRWLSNIVFLNDSNLDRRVQILKHSLDNGDVTIAEDLAQLLYKLNKNEAFACLKKGFLGGVSHCANVLSKLYRKQKNWHQDPAKVCWVQAAAQCGNTVSCNALLSNVDSAYVRCALAVMMELGFSLGTNTPVFQVGSTRDTLEKYQAVLQTEGLLEPYMEKVFANWIQLFEQFKLAR